MHEELDAYLATLTSQGVWLAAARRSAEFKAEPAGAGVRMDIVYVAAFPKDAVPEKFGEQRRLAAVMKIIGRPNNYWIAL